MEGILTSVVLHQRLNKCIIFFVIPIWDFLGLSESWLHNNSPSSALHVPGFNIFRRDRSKGRGGGVMIYIKDHINCHQICWPFDHELESTGLNIVLSSAMSLCSLLCIVHIPLIMIFVSHLKSYLKHVILKPR